MKIQAVQQLLKYSKQPMRPTVRSQRLENANTQQGILLNRSQADTLKSAGKAVVRQQAGDEQTEFQRGCKNTETGNPKIVR